MNLPQIQSLLLHRAAPDDAIQVKPDDVAQQAAGALEPVLTGVGRRLQNAGAYDAMDDYAAALVRRSMQTTSGSATRGGRLLEVFTPDHAARMLGSPGGSIRVAKPFLSDTFLHTKYTPASGLPAYMDKLRASMLAKYGPRIQMASKLPLAGPLARFGSVALRAAGPVGAVLSTVDGYRNPEGFMDSVARAADQNPAAGVASVSLQALTAPGAAIRYGADTARALKAAGRLDKDGAPAARRQVGWAFLKELLGLRDKGTPY